MKGTFLGTLVMTGIVALFCGCGKPPAPVALASPPQPARWEYAVFNYHDADYKQDKHTAFVCYIQRREKDENGMGIWVGSNNVFAVDSVLNQIGPYGWDLVWSDGRKFIVKRAAGIYTNGAFVVGETLVQFPK